VLARLQGRQWNEATSSFWLTKLIRNISEESTLWALYIILHLFLLFCVAETVCEIEPTACSRSQLFITNEGLRTESLQYNSFTGPRIKSCWGWGRDFSHPSRTDWPHPNFCKNENRVSSPGMERSGRDVNYPPPPNTEFEERVELYFYSIAWSSWPCTGLTFNFDFTTVHTDFPSWNF